MLVPAVGADRGTGQLDEPDSALHQSAGEQALAAEDGRGLVFCIEPVELPGGAGLAGQIGQAGDGGLHPVGQLIVGNGGFELIVVAEAVEGRGVEAFEEGELVALEGFGRFDPADVCDRVRARVEDRALIARGEEAAVEVVEAAGRDQAAVQDDEAGEVIALATQAVTEPGPHAGTTLQARAGVEEIVVLVCSGKFETIERTTASLSTCRATFGKSELTGIPLSPYC